ncbi:MULTISPECIES: LLM class flavin-dependent oxidoreductase [Pantoea]|jgi:FMN-dependent oxidoreductase (nitrilotriacetate monooxygenase family)|uniref:FMN-dependent oxidoreductase, nitrilotriacetate monooxygenase family n=1 Tax=Candidatus Pantoea symbiotica TaxID=1884370 RepID=A0A1I3ZM03_9GAMM|nr:MULTISPECIES: LLM class flavin-dependent oxidoreductase [Pantoea]MDY0928014.1 LLM class flavin-dependent oxidoreductase [Enterobacter sp. CFBP8995]MRS21388.1 NtaA/DmoA family FMN-dependent monooxygenase [Enterobacteriaceae bacterium RIT692]MRT26628.1 NtaA/DmoA family FMN-dependent monooxygenase [Enterobacteriaceae bacterium RIT697]MRT42945.1 NtaA/DmoA family FMN-dependent monooxygenase [Enterobacteriaceae bacterium RIT702]KAJ9430043.1 LLM class flavin-dependent oxidoreductase [Pantoea sp. Y
MANSQQQRRIRLGLFVQPVGQHVSGWRLTEKLGDPTDIDWLITIAKKAEAGKFDLFFVGDALATSMYRLPSTMARLEPLTMLSALAVNTKRIGLAATASTTFSDPFTMARSFSSLDHISRGRAAWNVVTSFSADVARNFSRNDMPNHAERYARAREFLEVAEKLWAGWEEGAVQPNKETGAYFVDDKIQPINHQGEHFQVQGPLNITRSPQGRPVIIEAGSSADGQKLAAETAEVIFTAAASLEEAQTFYRSQKDQVIAAGRNPDHVVIMPGVMPIVGRTREEAKALWKELNTLVDIENGLRQLSLRFSMDLSQFPLDGPVPEVPLGEGNQSRVKLMTDMAKRENLTLRELAAVAAGSRGHRVIVGTAEDIADDFELWLNEGGADGFNIMPAIMSEQLDLFVELVIPELRRRGLFRDDYEFATLRENLGLPVA